MPKGGPPPPPEWGSYRIRTVTAVGIPIAVLPHIKCSTRHLCCQLCHVREQHCKGSRDPSLLFSPNSQRTQLHCPHPCAGRSPVKLCAGCTGMGLRGRSGGRVRGRHPGAHAGGHAPRSALPPAGYQRRCCHHRPQPGRAKANSGTRYLHPLWAGYRRCAKPASTWSPASMAGCSALRSAMCARALGIAWGTAACNVM